jgi:hypothetical protein
VLAALVLACAAAAVYGWRSLQTVHLGFASTSDPARFDSARWRGDDLDVRARGAMARDLTRRGVLRGKARRDVIALLGEPTGDSVYGDREELSYAIGPGYMIDAVSLEIILKGGVFWRSLFTET